MRLAPPPPSTCLTPVLLSFSCRWAAVAVVVGAALAFHVWLALRVPRSRSAATNGGVAACSAAALRWVKHWRSRRRRVSGASAAATAAGKSSAVALQGVVTLEAPPHAELALEGGGQSPLSPADSAVGWGGSDGVDGGSSGSGSSGAASVCDEVEAGDVAAGGGGTVMGGGWRRTLRALRWRTLGVYLAPRLAILAYFGAWMAALPLSGAFTLHLHHYMVGWALASFAVFNHPLSGALLALSTAIFVQVGAACGWGGLWVVCVQHSCLGNCLAGWGADVCCVALRCAALRGCAAGRLRLRIRRHVCPRRRLRRRLPAGRERDRADGLRVLEQAGLQPHLLLRHALDPLVGGVGGWGVWVCVRVQGHKGPGVSAAAAPLSAGPNPNPPPPPTAIV